MGEIADHLTPTEGADGSFALEQGERAIQKRPVRKWKTDLISDSS